MGDSFSAFIYTIFRTERTKCIYSRYFWEFCEL